LNPEKIELKNQNISSLKIPDKKKYPIYHKERLQAQFRNQSFRISDPLSMMTSITHTLNDLYASSVHLNVIKFIRENAICND